MIEIINKYLANNLAGFKGLNISGKIPVSDELINETIQFFLSNTGNSSSSSSKKSSTKINLNPPELLGNVKKLRVRSQKGIINIEFTFNVE